MTTNPPLEQLNRLAGTWTTEATHPALPGVTVHGTAIVEWLEGERFLILRARSEHADFPDSISIIGTTEKDRVEAPLKEDPPTVTESGLSMHYFDSRGVFRVYEASVDDHAWRVWRDASGFSQRFTGDFADGGNTIAGRWELCRDEINWTDDLHITYRRQS